MARLNPAIDDELLQRFREAALKRFGFKKGAIKQATEEAISDWLKKVEKMKKEKKGD